MLWDPIRGLQVSATPEEKVRQAWISHMIGLLGFPKGLLSIEKGGLGASKRRLDLLCMTPSGDGLKPLLLMECKAGSAKAVGEEQVRGYNAFVQAPFICIADAEGAQTFWQEGAVLHSVPFLPKYEQLVQRAFG